MTLLLAFTALVFSHKEHAPLKLQCSFCHQMEAKASLPSVERCRTCHQKMEADPFTVENHKLPDFVFFRHDRHVNAKVECATCHGAPYTEVRPKPAIPLTMKGCVNCHKERQAKVGCATCHELGQ